MKGEKESEPGIMKHFIIDLITVKSLGNHRGATKGNPSNITRGKTGAIKMLKSSKDEASFVGEQIGSIYLFTCLLTSPPGLLSLTFKTKAHQRPSGIFRVQLRR